MRRLYLFIVLLVVCAPSLAAEPATKPATQAAGWGVRQVLVADPKLPHVLLIGDSILNGYNGHAA